MKMFWRKNKRDSSFMAVAENTEPAQPRKQMLSAEEYLAMVIANKENLILSSQDYSKDEKILMTAQAINRPDIAARIINGERIIAKDRRGLWNYNRQTYVEQKLAYVPHRTSNYQSKNYCLGKRRSRTIRRKALESLKGIQHCAYCDISFLLNKQVHIDHVVPISKGGLDCLTNLVKACNDCNFSKGIKSWIPLPGTLYADGSRESRPGGGNPRLTNRSRIDLSTHQEVT